MVARPNGPRVGRLCLVAVAITGVLYVPALDAQPSSGTSALVPVEEIAATESAPPSTAPVETPVAPAPEPTPAPEQASTTPELAPVPELESEAAPSLQTRGQPAQEEPNDEPAEEPTEEPTEGPTEEPTTPPDDTPLPESPTEPEPENEDDPEEFGRDFGDPEPNPDRVGQEDTTPPPTPTAPSTPSVSPGLPQTGRELLVLAQIGAGLLFVGMILRLPLQSTNGTLSGRDRELLILRTTLNRRSPHQCDRHVRIALEEGIDRETIDRVAAGPDASGWSDAEAGLLRAADELHKHATLSYDTWSALVKAYDKQQRVEIPMLVSQYG